MKLATLTYEVIKDAIELPSGINFDSFIRGDFDSDRDYISQISFAFNHINLALARLLTGKKTLLKIAKVATDDTGYAEFSDGEIISVLNNITPNYKPVFFRRYADGIAVEAGYASDVVYIEYRPFIPRFDMSSIRTQGLDENNEEVYVENEINLEDYGVTDEMCAYVKEHAKGGLMEYLSPELSYRHTQLAEGYFNALKTRHTDYPQREIHDVTMGGGAW